MPSRPAERAAAGPATLDRLDGVPMISSVVQRVTSKITIGRQIEDVFAVLTNVDNTATWFPGDVQERWTSPPPHGVGSTRHAVVRMRGMTTENDATVTEYDPPTKAVIRGTSPNAPFVGTLVFRPVGDGATHVVVTTEFAFTGGSRIVGPLFAAWYGRAWTRGLERLKELMEGGRL